MIVICAWCEKLIGYKCDHCGETLIPGELVVKNWRGCKQHRPVLICPNPENPFVFPLDEQKESSHGICKPCVAGIKSERDKLTAQTTPKPIRAVPKKETEGDQ